MPEFQLSIESLEARDVASDRASVAQRMEAYRHLMPSVSPAIIVKERAGQTAPSEAGIPEVPARELTVEFLRTAIAEHGAQYVLQVGN
jgi:predicted O-methyltransferase YrrM